MKEKLFTRNFTLLLLGQASSLLGNNTLKFALSMFVLEETGSATVFATILALAMAPRYSWPSPPTLKMPAWAATAMARPVRHRVADLARVSPRARGELRAPRNMAP